MHIILPVRFTHVVACISSLFLCIAVQYFILYIYHYLSILMMDLWVVPSFKFHNTTLFWFSLHPL